jgi:Leucine-rich repeat (LRR) protein
MSLKIKTIESEEFISYDKLTDIPIDDYEYIWYLSCRNCKYTDIDFIKLFPNLKDLDASYNNINIMPYHELLENIEIRNNKLSRLPTLPCVINMDASYNKIRIINHYPMIKKLNISNNILCSLTIEPTLIELNCSYNLLTNILCNSVNSIYMLEKLDIKYNMINNINFIYVLNNLTSYDYSNNNITYIAPHIKRLYEGGVYKKRRHSIDRIRRFKIHNILLKKPLDINVVIDMIKNNTFLTEEAKKQMIYYCDFDEPNYKIPINYKELLCSVWAIIKKREKTDSPLHIKLLLKLNYIYNKPHICRCQSCQLINLSMFIE